MLSISVPDSCKASFMFEGPPLVETRQAFIVRDHEFLNKNA